MSENPRRLNVDVGGLSITLALLFFWFWHQSGWYRIDCALGVEKACNLIAAEYEAEPRP